jgi:hypothetical protein
MAVAFEDGCDCLNGLSVRVELMICPSVSA